MHARLNSRIFRALIGLACVAGGASAAWLGMPMAFAQENAPAQEQSGAQLRTQTRPQASGMPQYKYMIEGAAAQSLAFEEQEQAPEDAPAMEPYGQVRIRALDKITARTETIDLKIGDMVEFGALTITGKACRKSAPIESPESAAFLQVWEFPLGAEEKEAIDNAQLRFSGWMFASSPGLSAMDHPIYDIWVLDCIGESLEEAAVVGEQAIENIQISKEGGAVAGEDEDDIKNLELLDAIQTETLRKGNQ